MLLWSNGLRDGNKRSRSLKYLVIVVRHIWNSFRIYGSRELQDKTTKWRERNGEEENFFQYATFVIFL